MDRKISRGVRNLTPADLADAAALQRAIDEANDLLPAEKRGNQRARVGPARLAEFAKALGGSKHPNQWTTYKNGDVRIPTVDKMIAALFFKKRPQDLFTWQFPELTVLPPLENGTNLPLPLILQMTISAAHSTMQPPTQQALLGELLKIFLIAAPHQRERIVKKAQEIIGFG